MMGELGFFLSLQIRQIADGSIIYQQKYLRELLKKYGLENNKYYDTPIPTSTKLDADSKCEDVEASLKG